MENAVMILSNEGKCQWFQHVPVKTGTMKVSLKDLGIDNEAESWLPQLLADGWTPARETSFGNGSVLIIWQRAKP